MSSESPQRSVALNSPVDPSIVRVLRTLDPIARESDCAYFVAGATARDLVVVNIHGLQPGRALRHLDILVRAVGLEPTQPEGQPGYGRSVLPLTHARV